MVDFVACMVNLFNRLPTTPSEDEKLKVLKRNVSPYYIHAMGLTEVKDVAELLFTCKRLEAAKYLAGCVCPTSTRLNLLEPDLAGPSTSTSSRTPVQASISGMDRPCWNCGSTGHRFSNCPTPREKNFCFRCGKPGVTKYSCPCQRPRGTGNGKGGQR